jgi:hypothetical protein
LEGYYTAPYGVAGFPDKMLGLCTDEFCGLLENFPLEYSQKLFILWKNFFVVAAGLEVTATTKKHASDLENQMEKACKRHVTEVFGDNPLFDSHQSLKKLMSPDFEKDDFLRTKFRTKKDKVNEKEAATRAIYAGRSALVHTEVSGASLWKQYGAAKTEVNNILLPTLYSILLSDGYHYTLRIVVVLLCCIMICRSMPSGYNMGRVLEEMRGIIHSIHISKTTSVDEANAEEDAVAVDSTSYVSGSFNISTCPKFYLGFVRWGPVASDGGNPAFKSHMADKLHEKEGKKRSIEDGREAQRARAAETTLGAMLGNSVTSSQATILADQTPAKKRGKGPGSDETSRTHKVLQNTSRIFELSVALEMHLAETADEEQEYIAELRVLLRKGRA